MYLTFYGLKDKPFSTTPDPKFLYLTPGHREALAQLVYAIREGTGLTVLTGEVGTGKTLLLQALRERLDSTAAVAFVFNSGLPFDGLLEYVLEDLGVTARGRSRAQRLVALNRFLIERRRTGQRAVLVIDEAQNLDTATLEQIRLLSNFETPSEKLLQIILVGQPELQAKLALPELRQFRQRIGLRCTISPLQAEEISAYVRTRLQIAGARDLNLFSERALRRIARYAGGIPRVVNLVCDHCLILGYADQQRALDERVVKAAIDTLEGGPRARRPSPGPARWAVAGAAGLLVSLLAALLVRPDALWDASRTLTDSFTALLGTAEALFRR